MRKANAIRRARRAAEKRLPIIIQQRLRARMELLLRTRAFDAPTPEELRTLNIRFV